MPNEITISGPHKDFENIKKIDENGIEYWEARELLPLLGYERWEKAEEVIGRAARACINSGQAVDNHFHQTVKMVEIGSNTVRKVRTYKLDRYACYLIAQNGDPNKSEIALAQTYFAIQTRKQEIFEQLSNNEKRLFIRNEVSDQNKKLFSTAKQAGVTKFGLFNDAGYKGLYGMRLSDISDIEKRKNIKKGQLLDRAGSTELAANLFRITQTDEKLKKDKTRGESQASQTHFMVGGKVRQTIKDIGGILPELLLPEKHIKEIKKEVKNLKGGGKRLKSKVLVAVFFTLAGSVFFTSNVSAKELIKEADLNLEAVRAGYTLETDDKAFSIGIQPGAAEFPLTAEISKFSDSELPGKQGEYIRVSDVYEFDVNPAAPADGTQIGAKIFTKNITLKMKISKGDIYRKKIFFIWDRNKSEWIALKGSNEDLKTREVTISVPFDFGQVAVFEHPTTIEGFGSWYNYQRAANRKKYADGIATHLYPQGTKLKVTNLENGKSAQVKVVSYWDKKINEKRRRAADIVKAAFLKIASVSDGVIPVRIEAIPEKIKTAAAAGGGEEKPAPKAAAQADLSSIKSHAAIVMDEGGNVLFEKNSDKAYSIASISKLFTAEVFLKTNTDWKKQVKLIPEDNAEGAKLFSPAGDVITVKDLFYSTLTGSTNNGAKALARSTGLSKEEFAKRMNEEAKSAGLANTEFFEPTGLDPRNVSTAKEIAIFSMRSAIQPEITQGTTKPVYSFDEISSVDKMVHHDVKSTDILLKESHPAYEIISAKTGFLYEALHCLMMKVKSNNDGKIYTVVILGAPTGASLFGEMRVLLAKFVP